jgi:hypothetical protein
MISAASDRSEDKKDLTQACIGFSKQFKEKVVKITDDGVILRNYMNGHNGICRYRYSPVGAIQRLGYGPYALSGILGESWYPFAFGVDGIFNAYAASYPLTGEMLSL